LAERREEAEPLAAPAVLPRLGRRRAGGHPDPRRVLRGEPATALAEDSDDGGAKIGVGAREFEEIGEHSLGGARGGRAEPKPLRDERRLGDERDLEPAGRRRRRARESLARRLGGRRGLEDRRQRPGPLVERERGGLAEEPGLDGGAGHLDRRLTERLPPRADQGDLHELGPALTPRTGHSAPRFLRPGGRSRPRSTRRRRRRGGPRRARRASTRARSGPRSARNARRRRAAPSRRRAAPARRRR